MSRNVVGSVWFIDLVIDPVVACEGVLVVLGSLSSAGIDQRLVEDDTSQIVSDFEGANVRDLNAQLLSTSNLVSVSLARVLNFISAEVLRCNSTRQHCNFKVIDLDLWDNSIYVVHWKWSNS